MTKHIEDSHQTLIMQYCNYTNIPAQHGLKAKISDYIFSIGNGGKRNAREAKRMKAQGVKAGVPDMFLHIPVKDYAGLFIELKRPQIGKIRKGTVSDKQKMYIEKLKKAHYKVCVCYGYHDAQNVIDEYLNMAPYDKD